MNVGTLFTVKHVSPGEEALYPGIKQVSLLFDPASTHAKSCVAIKTDGCDAVEFFDTGIVYVMNAAGKTVETYVLGPAASKPSAMGRAAT